ncbi:hypothetical protein EON62_04070, partial [archaeon]
DEYLAWVHDPYSFGKDRDARLFQWSFLEPLSKTMWWMIPLVWLPVIAYMWQDFLAAPYWSATNGAAVLLGGLVLWTFVEYAIHRFVFHLDDRIPDHGIAILLHFLLHGVHHKVPMDRYRLVMPPILFAALASTVYALLYPVSRLLPSPLYHALFSSVIFGYVCYDMVHYSQHHMALNRKGYFGRMKSYHMKHHYSGLQNLGFGITNKLWDYVFGTVLDVSVSKGITNTNMSAISKDL